MRLYKYTLLAYLIFASLGLLSQKIDDPIKINVDKINPIFATIEKTSARGLITEDVLKTDTTRISEVTADETLDFVGYELVYIDQPVTMWKKINGHNDPKVNCCWGGPDDCWVWTLIEYDLIDTDSIRLYRERANLIADIEVFPNPASDIVFVRSNDKIIRAKIFDLLGREVQRIKVDAERMSIPIRQLEDGHFVLQLEFENEISVHQFVKQ